MLQDENQLNQRQESIPLDEPAAKQKELRIEHRPAATEGLCPVRGLGRSMAFASRSTVVT